MAEVGFEPYESTALAINYDDGWLVCNQWTIECKDLLTQVHGKGPCESLDCPAPWEYLSQRGERIWGALFGHSLPSLKLSPYGAPLKAPGPVSAWHSHCPGFVFFPQSVRRLDTQEMSMPWLPSIWDVKHSVSNIAGGTLRHRHTTDLYLYCLCRQTNLDFNYSKL